MEIIMIKEIKLGDKIVKYDLQRKKVKNINIRIKRDMSVHVSASPKVSQKDIERILREKSDFILSAIEKYRRLSATEKKRAANPGSIELFGSEMPVVTESGKKNQVVIKEGRIILTLKNTSDTSAREKSIRSSLDTLLKTTVEEICREVYPKFADVCQSFPTLKFRHMKSRWGSCNFKNNTLTFNYYLVHAPRVCIEFVIYHEFTHFICHDHSPNFYRELSRFIPNHKELKKELEKHRNI